MGNCWEMQRKTISGIKGASPFQSPSQPTLSHLGLGNPNMSQRKTASEIEDVTQQISVHIITWKLSGDRGEHLSLKGRLAADETNLPE